MSLKMTEFKINEIGLKVGLEIHQQLDTGKKLFCNCNSVEDDEYTNKFSRNLRATKSELGKLIQLHFLKIQNQKQSSIILMQTAVV